MARVADAYTCDEHPGKEYRLLGNGVIRTDIGSKRHSLQAVELSQGTQAAVKIVSNPSNGGPISRLFGMPVMRTRWMAGAAAHKSG